MRRPAALLVFGALMGCGDKSVQQHGLTFRPVRQGSNQLWLVGLEAGGNTATLPFYFLPDDTVDVRMDDGLVAWMLAPEQQVETLYVSIDPDAHHYTFTAGAEIGRFIEDLGLLGGPKVEMAFSKPSDRPENLQVVDCSRAQQDTMVLVVEQGRGNLVEREGRCVKASYHVPQDSLRVADRLCYGLAGVL